MQGVVFEKTLRKCNIVVQSFGKQTQFENLSCILHVLWSDNLTWGQQKSDIYETAFISETAVILDLVIK